MWAEPASLRRTRKGRLAVAVLAAGLLAGAATANASAKDFSWAVSGGGRDADDADGIGAGPDGKLVVAGGFEGTSRLDARHAVMSTGGPDVFAVGYGSRGKVRWARRFGGPGADQAFDNDVDSRGSAVITGSFNASVDFGGSVLVSRGASRPRYGDAFLLKLGPSGRTLWVRQIGGQASDGGDEIVAGPRDGVWVIGDSEGKLRLGRTVLPGGGGRDSWAARYRADGSLVWARSFGGPGYEQSHGIEVNGEGASFVTGEFRGEARIGSRRLVSAGSAPDVFLAKLDGNGRTKWARRFGDADREIGRGVGTDARGNVYFTGEYAGTIRIGNRILTSAGDNDMFLAKADRAGRVKWAVSMGGPGVEGGPEIEVDRAGNSYLAGNYSATARFGRRALTAPGARAAFVAKYSPGGRLVWLAGSGPSPFATLGELTLGPRYVSVLGRFARSVQLGGSALTGSGGTDFFVAGLPRR